MSHRQKTTADPPKAAAPASIAIEAKQANAEPNNGIVATRQRISNYARHCACITSSEPVKQAAEAKARSWARHARADTQTKIDSLRLAIELRKLGLGPSCNLGILVPLDACGRLVPRSVVHWEDDLATAYCVRFEIDAPKLRLYHQIARVTAGLDMLPLGLGWEPDEQLREQMQLDASAVLDGERLNWSRRWSLLTDGGLDDR